MIDIMNELPPSAVSIQDGFWSPRLAVNAQRALFHQWQELEKSGCIDNFRLVTGEKEGFREGWFFADSDAHKWLDAAARSYAIDPSLALKALMDGYIRLIGQAQTPDGYLFTYNQLHFPVQRWVNLHVEHELYCHGHLIEAGVSHFQATGERTALDIAIRAADLLVRDFLQAGPEQTPGHEEIEIALLRLSQVTYTPSYLELARHFLEQRGRIPFFAFKLARQFLSSNQRGKQVAQRRQAYSATHHGYASTKLPPGNVAKKPRFSTARWYLNALSGRYAQQHAPIRQQTKPVGHAVRFGYLETAVAMLCQAQGDATLLPALRAAWEQMVLRHMYVTGGVGAVPGLEGFGRDDELDPEYAYAETCAALACLFWNWEMALITAEARYSDLFEWQLYNAAAVGMGLTGERYLYNNPLTCRGGITRRPWFAVPCCPSNLSRTWASLGRYLVSHDADNLWFHQYVGSQGTVELATTTRWEMNSALPYGGNIRIQLEPTVPTEFAVHLRIPSWADKAEVQVNEEMVGVPSAAALPDSPAQGYDPRLSRFLSLCRTWHPGDIITLTLNLPIVARQPHPRMKGYEGKVAFTRGPLVYCLESTDNPELDVLTAGVNAAAIRSEWEPELFGGTMVLRGMTHSHQPLTFIPYALWANRGESQMQVWVNCLTGKMPGS